jgi:hypothetical protein
MFLNSFYRFISNIWHRYIGMEMLVALVSKVIIIQK